MKNYLASIILALTLFFVPFLSLGQVNMSKQMEGKIKNENEMVLQKKRSPLPPKDEERKIIKNVLNNNSPLTSLYFTEYSFPRKENGKWVMGVRLVNDRGINSPDPDKERKIILGNVGEISPEEVENNIKKSLTLFFEEHKKIIENIQSNKDGDLDIIKNATIGVGARDRFGTGVIIRKKIINGSFVYTVITADHVIKNAGKYVILPIIEDHIPLTQVVFRDADLDIALLELITKLDLPVASIADPDRAFSVFNQISGLGRIPAVVIGYPTGKSRAFEPVTTLGKASSGVMKGKVAYTCKVSDGNSGSGVFIKQDDQWKLLSICTFGLAFMKGGYGPSPWNVQKVIRDYDTKENIKSNQIKTQTFSEKMHDSIDSFIYPWTLLIPRRQ